MSLYKRELNGMLPDIKEAIKSAGLIGITPEGVVEGMRADEGLLVLLEVLVKINAGYSVSYTEDIFVKKFGMLNKNRTLNASGRKFVNMMISSTSNCRPYAFTLMEKYRKGDL